MNYLFAWKHKIKEQFPDCMEMFFSHGHVLRERNWVQSDSNGHAAVGSLSLRKGLELGWQKNFGEKKIVKTLQVYINAAGMFASTS